MYLTNSCLAADLLAPGLVLCTKKKWCFISACRRKANTSSNRVKPDYSGNRKNDNRKEQAMVDPGFTGSFYCLLIWLTAVKSYTRMQKNMQHLVSNFARTFWSLHLGLLRATILPVVWSQKIQFRVMWWNLRDVWWAVKASTPKQTFLSLF